MKRRRSAPAFSEQERMMHIGSVVTAFLRAVVIEDPKTAILGLRQKDDRLWLIASRVQMVPAADDVPEHILPDSEVLIHQTFMPLKLLPFLKQTLLDMGHGIPDLVYGMGAAEALYAKHFEKKAIKKT